MKIECKCCIHVILMLGPLHTMAEGQEAIDFHQASLDLPIAGLAHFFQVMFSTITVSYWVSR
jgi:hypothetical protein